MRRVFLSIGLTGLALTLTACGASGAPVKPETPIAMVEPTPEVSTPTPVPGPISATEMGKMLAEADIPAFDPVEWRERIGLVEGPVPRVLLDAPTYGVGDVEEFSVFHAEGKGLYEEVGYRTVEAQLVYQNDVVAMWVETGLPVDQGELAQAADTFAAEIYPTMHDIFGEEPLPGVDNDVHLNVLNIVELPFGSGALFDPTHEYVKAIKPDSNQREMVFIAIRGLDEGGTVYLGQLVHEFKHLIQFNGDPNEAVWLDEGLAQLAERITGYPTSVAYASFVTNPEVQLNIWEGTDYDYGAAYLFSLYLWERTDDETLRALENHPANGLSAVDIVLAGHGLTADDLFADWLVANYLDDPTLNDGRYGYQSEALGQMCPSQRVTELPFGVSNVLPQYSAHYIEIEGQGEYVVDFYGNTEVELMPIEAHSGESFWWSNWADRSDTTLTREFDLSGLDTATLQFWTWSDHSNGISHVLISTDGGESWDFLESSTMFKTDSADGPYFHGPPGWRNESIDLTSYVGGPVLVRFEFITDQVYDGSGWAIDDVAIPELDYAYDVEVSEAAWDARGFHRTSNVVPEHWALYLIKHGRQTTVERLDVDVDGAAETTFTLGDGIERATLVIGAMAPATRLRAEYDLTIGGTGTVVSQATSASPGILLEEDFEDICSGWETLDAPDMALGYADGGYFMEAKEPDTAAWTLVPRKLLEGIVPGPTVGDHPEEGLRDVIIDVDTTQETSTYDSLIGVTCRHQAESGNFYEFDIDSQGYYQIWAAIDGEYRPIWNWTYSDKINRGPGASNHLTVSCIGDTLSLTVNDQLLAEVQNSELSIGKVGLAVTTFSTGGARASFDNLVLTLPEESRD